ncbi:MAG: alpha/beta hydrolase [Candidatus Sphingomonas phytovorans]|nr:alpha/beta hydrolase [Sphingomonas sp.]WEK00344.1 MAG: alpha/beta hydrolase [Sphingomonas sp.]
MKTVRLGLMMLGATALASCDGPKVTYDKTTTVPEMVSAPITLKAGDGVEIFGRTYAATRPKAVVLLFHQAGSSKDEYTEIAPRLRDAGYSAIAIDQRSGGSLYGDNETVAHLGKSNDYLDAKQDLQAALDFASRMKLPVIVWGSSYSSSLVFPLAVENPGKIKAILAFSPGEYFPDETLVKTAAAKVHVPVFVTSASDPKEIAEAKAVVAAVPGGRAEQYVPAIGFHGSSTLIAAKDPKGAEANWSAVMAFLRKVTP